MKKYFYLVIFLGLILLNLTILGQESNNDNPKEDKNSEVNSEKTTTNENPDEKKYDLLPKFSVGDIIQEITTIEREDGYSSYYSDSNKRDIQVKFKILEIKKLLPSKLQVQLQKYRIENSNGYSYDNYLAQKDEWVTTKFLKDWTLKVEDYSDKISKALKSNSNNTKRFIKLINAMVFLPDFFPKIVVGVGDMWDKNLENYLQCEFYSIDLVDKVTMKFDKIQQKNDKKIAHISYSAQSEKPPDGNTYYSTKAKINGKILFDLDNQRLLLNTFSYIVENEENWDSYSNVWETSQQVSTTYSYSTDQKSHSSETPTAPKGEEE